jgi:hypothetical protein
MDTRSVNDASSVAGSETSKMKLQLPASCDPPQPGAPVKQLVWIVRSFLILLLPPYCPLTIVPRSLAAPATWAVPW